jgi:hypothetical protein
MTLDFASTTNVYYIAIRSIMGRGLLVQLNQEDGKRRRSLSPVQQIQGDDPASSEPGPSKRPRTSPISLHSWLHPGEAPRLSAHSPALHDSTSTFLSFSLSFLPPVHITSETSLAKEIRRIIRELNVPGLVGEEVMRGDEGAFQDGEGRTGKGKERAREPDHRMWAVRTLCLKEGKDGTGGETDYQVRETRSRHAPGIRSRCVVAVVLIRAQLLEAYNDDGEKFGGERVLRALRDERAVDVLTVCCRWVSAILPRLFTRP